VSGHICATTGVTFGEFRNRATAVEPAWNLHAKSVGRFHVGEYDLSYRHPDVFLGDVTRLIASAYARFILLFLTLKMLFGRSSGFVGQYVL
jgi:hypothetical protein